jgi:hypothetical protein
MEDEPFSFVKLDQKIDAIPEHPSLRLDFGAKEKSGIGLIAIPAILILLLRWIPSPPAWMPIVFVVLLALEIIGLLLLCAATAEKLDLRPSRERRSFAEQLDFDLPHYLDLITWLRTFPRERIDILADYTRQRLERLRARQPLLLGAVDKLGALPLLGALALQFHNMSWPPRPNLGEAVLVIALVIGYWAGLVSLGMRFRLELYDMLLTQARVRHDDAGAPAMDSTSAAKRVSLTK